MKVTLNSGEQYPFYDFCDSILFDKVECDVPEETVLRWKRIMAEFEEMQYAMAASMKCKLIDRLNKTDP